MTGLRWGRFYPTGPWHIFRPDPLHDGWWTPACNPTHSRPAERIRDLAERPTPSQYGDVVVCHAARWGGGCRQLATTLAAMSATRIA